MSLVALLLGLGLWLPEEAWAQCSYRQEILPGKTFYVNSPNWPFPYQPGASCQWTATTTPNGILVLDCRQLHVPRGYLDCIDFLTASPTGNRGDGKSFCGDSPFELVSTSQQLSLFLDSDRRSWGGSFSCSISAQEKLRPSTSDDCDCGYSYKLRIVGGTETGINEFPFMSGIVSEEERAIICGAAIISSSSLVSAAHCLVGRRPATLAALVGEHDLRQGRETDATKLIRVGSVVLHPGYNKTNQANDIALVRTASPIQFTMKVGPVCLPWRSTRDDDLVGADLTALGWGTKDFGGETSDTLQKVNIRWVAMGNCDAAYKGKTQPKDQICTYAKGKDACQFDSGGPLVYFDTGTSRYFQLGIISYGRGCGWDVPSVNTKITSYLDWIKRNTQGERFCVK